MNPGMIIEAHTDTEAITIEATGIYKRKYSWNSKIKEFTHSPRWTRWYGSKGMYCSGGDMEMHAVLQEGQQHFYSEEDIYYWLQWKTYGGRRALVYTSDGLVVLWEEQKHPTENFYALSVDLWQIYIQGERPSNLKGARDDKVVIISRQTTPYTSVGEFQPSEPKKINGRWFTGKALDIMKDQKISPQEVENVINSDTPTPEKDGRELFYLNPKYSHPTTVTTDNNGKVLLAH